MKKSSKKIAVVLILLLTGIGLLIMKSISDTGVYYRTVSEVITDNALPDKRGVRISGEVEEGSINFDQTDLLLTFIVRDMDDDSKKMKVKYKGVKPDAFKPDIEVILEGRYDKAANTFNAQTLLAKCPSKYESEVEQVKE